MFGGTLTEPQPRQNQQDPRKRILLVDDDAEQLLTLELRLQKLGYETCSAHTGGDALAIAARQRIDLITLDLRLPDRTGFEVCSELADGPATCDIPVIILSAMERPDIVRRARAAGCEYYVRKPYDPNVLLTLIEQSLDQARRGSW